MEINDFTKPGILKLMKIYGREREQVLKCMKNLTTIKEVKVVKPPQSRKKLCDEIGMKF